MQILYISRCFRSFIVVMRMHCTPIGFRVGSAGAGAAASAVAFARRLHTEIMYLKDLANGEHH